jgi:hypothetical protein
MVQIKHAIKTFGGDRVQSFSIILTTETNTPEFLRF